MDYIYSLSSFASFTGKDLLVYTFGPLQQKDTEFIIFKVEEGTIISREYPNLLYSVRQRSFHDS